MKLYKVSIIEKESNNQDIIFSLIKYQCFHPNLYGEFYSKFNCENLDYYKGCLSNFGKLYSAEDCGFDGDCYLHSKKDVKEVVEECAEECVEGDDDVFGYILYTYDLSNKNLIRLILDFDEDAFIGASIQYFTVVNKKIKNVTKNVSARISKLKTFE